MLGRKPRSSPTPARAAGAARRSAGAYDLVRLCAVVLVVVASLACTKPATGPAFTAAEPPANDRARLYLYRVDPQGSLSRVRISLNGREIGDLRDHEYETLELAAGSHRLRAGLRGFGFVAWGWNEQPIRLEPGETAFVELSVRLAEHTTPSARELEIGGRPEASASENVFIRRPGRVDAIESLETTTRRVPSDP